MKRTAVFFMSCILMFPVAVSRAQEIAFVPIGADGAYTIVGDEIILQGGGQLVELAIMISGWDANLDGTPLLGTYQAAYDSTSLASGTGAPLTAFATPDATAGAFVILKRCTVGQLVDPNGPRCDISSCPAGEFCIDNSGLVVAGFDPLCGVATILPDYEYFCTTGPGATTGVPDDGTARYGGTLLIEVPATAAGTYTIAFKNNPQISFMLDFAGTVLTPLTLTPARISIACQTNLDCDDGNACTDDACTASNTCVNAQNFNANVFCCDPAAGGLTTIDDGSECTDDVCDANTGVVTHPFSLMGAPCGNTSSTECDAPDICDGSGVCLANPRTNGTPCGDPSNAECDLADTCNGSGICQTNLAANNSPCGDPSMSQCTNADTCNGAGTCLDNDVPNGNACDDGLFCNTGEACTAGVCSGGTGVDCNDSLPCTNDSCNELSMTCDNILASGNCLIAGVCYSDGELNPANDCESCNTFVATSFFDLLIVGTPCDDGDPCTGTGRPGIGVDTCDDAGVCMGVEDPECNDDCGFAIPALTGTTTSANENGGPDDAEASCQPNSNGDVWFVYTALCDGITFASTTGSVLLPSNDSVLSIYDECPDAGGTEIACDDDSGVGLHAAINFNTIAGEDYFLRVAGFENNTGTIALNISTVDDCVINGICYAAGDRNPANDCEACIPSVSSSDWSNLFEGTACGNPSDTECDSPDACDGLGICESNPKPDNIVCTDDGIECSLDVCQSGLCVHPPRPSNTPCGDPADRECDGPDSCDNFGSCLPNYKPRGTSCGRTFGTQCDLADSCDSFGLCDANLVLNGTACDNLDVCSKNDACNNGLCVGQSIADAPTLLPVGPRAFSVEALPTISNAPVALRLTSSDWTCLDKYIAADGSVVNTPVVQSLVDWGVVIVQGVDIVPGPNSSYTVTAECATFSSLPTTVDIPQWGDVTSNGIVNAEDILAVVLAFQLDFSLGIPFEAFDISPCEPNGIINASDILLVVKAFQLAPYSDTGCPVPCP